MDKKLILVIFLPIIIIVIYSIIFRIDLLNVFLNLNPYFVIAFFITYLAQLGIVSIRDSKIAGVDFLTAFKARFFANSISLIIPGAMGPDLARAVIYLRKGLTIDRAFSLSLLESFYDVNVIAFMFLVLIWFRFSPLEIILILTALGNIFMWFLGIGYVYGTSNYNLNRVEQKVFSIKYLKPLEEAYLNGKVEMKEKLKNPLLTFSSSILTLVGYLVQSLPFYLISRSFLQAIIINTTYQVALLVPIPSAAGVAELSLTALVPPLVVLQIRVLELISYSLGFVYVKEISIDEIRKEVKEVWKTI
ncbi:lysylphosphatidylglycerol synthase domain-containing protein [Stygiolobus caldivivus]|uniref:Uncharacterized protein n=1 Tax=Stygiolobus caldivivus TaxID=2824673 RepID=A0A8D5U5Y8_9CREN|nr:lysylphosphatidylglycerol synthase domain-containing protein [Stygiolobus caldivivus]BCU69471.1 hypothetical protein KN1_07680 [Stygiolobus caldivivus]